MVATVETISEPRPHGKCCGTSISSAASAVNKSTESEKSVDVYNLQRSMTTDHKFRTADDLLIDHCSLIFERSTTDRNGNVQAARRIVRALIFMLRHDLAVVQSSDDMELWR